MRRISPSGKPATQLHNDTQGYRLQGRQEEFCLLSLNSLLLVGIPLHPFLHETECIYKQETKQEH